ncbi:phthiodiolone/phenolphthiodiolone dimycocerosates ketoreductase domain protein [Mycobacterium ulcerans str. Harvey]|uniref:Phthiodiolone/phenolphthiodiolone dimycocerosates ketoreductase domain protein n=1 Tax=Mycobacterium ulcerans str. Harvey TaxID=1299332 RepID=A0ABN0QZS3_MYCUL|nr:phthiodiolone/phenolphthiodiolone dimycocerosates ketoreductase domain protein [Mycobacterium ulcerans str. Harvey]
MMAGAVMGADSYWIGDHLNALVPQRAGATVGGDPRISRSWGAAGAQG